MSRSPFRPGLNMTHRCLAPLLHNPIICRNGKNWLRRKALCISLNYRSIFLLDQTADLTCIEKMIDLELGEEIAKKALGSTGEYLSLIHISEPTRLGMISYAVFCLKKKKKK